MLSSKSFLHLPIFFLTNYLDFYQNGLGNEPGLQRDWWRPCIQRSRSMIPQHTRNVGKILSSESLPLWFAVDFRLPRIWNLEILKRIWWTNLTNNFQWDWQFFQVSFDYRIPIYKFMFCATKIDVVLNSMRHNLAPDSKSAQTFGTHKLWLQAEKL